MQRSGAARSRISQKRSFQRHVDEIGGDRIRPGRPPFDVQRLAAADVDFKAEQKRTAQVTAQLKETAKLAEAEMAKLQKLFG